MRRAWRWREMRTPGRGGALRKRVPTAAALFAGVLLMLALASPAPARVFIEGMAVTDYMFRGVNMLAGAPAIQPSVSITGGRYGLSFDAWLSWALRDRGTESVRDLDEMDLIANYSRALGPVDTFAGLFSLHYYTMDTWPDVPSTVFEGFAGVTLRRAPFTPTLTVNYELSALSGHDLYVEGDLDYRWTMTSGQPVMLGLHAGWYRAEWVDVDGISDITFSVSLPVDHRAFSLTPWFSTTWIPDRSVNPELFELYGGLVISSALFVD